MIRPENVHYVLNLKILIGMHKYMCYKSISLFYSSPQRYETYFMHRLI